MNSGELLEQGAKLHDDGKYKEAIALYRKISRNDTNYSRSLHELSLSSCADSNFQAAIAYAEEGLKLYPDLINDWYPLLANANDYLGKWEEAVSYYDKLLAVNPYDYQTWFNKGIAYYRVKNYVDAQKSFQQSVIIYPFYASPHYFMSVIAYSEGKLPQAMLSAATYLLMKPDGRYRKNCINLLNSVAVMDDEVSANVKKAKGNNVFEEQQEIIVSKIAMDRGYKLQTDLEDAITRQFQVLLEKLSYEQAQQDFFMQFYVPYYKQVYDSKQFNLLVNYIFSGLGIKKVDDFVKRNKKDLVAFADECGVHFNKLKETQVLNYQQRKDAPSHFYYREGKVLGKGGTWTVTKDNWILEGDWVFYHANGTVKSKGAFVHDKYNGEWQFFYSNGVKKEKGVYENGVEEGPCTFWFDNGSLQAVNNYKAGKLEGERKVYYYSGELKRTEQYKGNEKNGLVVAYYTNGLVQYKVNFVNGLKEGVFTEYYDNGQLEATTTYAADKAEGPYKKYNRLGLLVQEGSYTNDKQTGAWKTWYNEGQLKETYSYVDGKMDGEYKELYQNGVLKQRQVYSKGRTDGKEENFAKAGWLYSEALYDKESFKQVKFYDATGKVISESNAKGSSSLFTFYDEYGNKVIDSYLSRRGDKDGKFTSYFSNGQVKATSSFSNSNMQGEKVVYYANGSVSEKYNYKDGKLDGFYISNYKHGRVNYQGWYVDDNKEGVFVTFDERGRKKEVTNYKNGEKDRYSEFYHPDGKIHYEQLFDEGWLKHVTQWDTTGKVVADVELSNEGNGDVVFKHNNGKDYIKCTYRGYNLDGKHETYFFDGSVNVTSFYKKGNSDSTYRSYYYGGQLHSECTYRNGRVEGNWTVYYENGKPMSVSIYRDGYLNGLYKEYNDDGTLDRDIWYKNGYLDSFYTIYADNGKRAVVLIYEMDELVGYTYEGKDGKLVKPVLLPNGTGKVVAYFANGTKSAELDFEEGVVNGNRNIYFTNGATYISQVRSLGVDEGPKKVFYLNGTPEKEQNYLHDKLSGVSKDYYRNGKLKSEVNWYNGEEHGVATYYDESGKLKQTRVYYYGILQSVR
ncbi:phophatidylinositol-4-phosphate 5-kinase [Filimonas lacunae]|nr:phophatidylinositol-4-phosphate 5-kinase [Filimonas lacunae]